MTRSRPAIAVVAAALGASLLAGCGSTRTAAATYRARYLADVAPVNATLAALVRRYGDQDALSATEAAPLVAAYRRLQVELLRQTWPPSARRDVRALATIAGWVVGDLAEGVSPAGVGRLAADQDQVRATAATVRADLGLPPPAEPSIPASTTTPE